MDGQYPEGADGRSLVADRDWMTIAGNPLGLGQLPVKRRLARGDQQGVEWAWDGRKNGNGDFSISPDLTHLATVKCCSIDDTLLTYHIRPCLPILDAPLKVRPNAFDQRADLSVIS